MINIYKILMNNKSNDKDIRKCRKSNNSCQKCDKENKNLCPYCEGEKFIKYGFYNGIQRYKCKNEGCGKTFSNDINSPFRYSKKFKGMWEKYFEVFLEGISLRECAIRMNITLVTAFFWRHRFLHDFCKKNYIEKIGSYVELTKLVLNENFKGDREYHGEKRDKIIIVNAVNDYIDIIPIFAARNFIGLFDIRDNIIPRLDRKAYVVGFLDGRLKVFAKGFNEINKVKLKENKISNIDIEYSNKIKRWLSKFNGVASKYLGHYLSWRAFEYKNSIEYKKDKPVLEKINFKVNVKAEINTYISWEKIKAKVIPI
ncbi:hypothetical protein [Clostridium sp.]|uniref:transposase-like zinc-binding domain-containing protein n=1 Tax=Clostridium sp. TaxID=1506 RepID=UPI0026064118|nr:hypothetical protein [Clostridium sp.]